jgi:hypothetical protein
MSATATILYFLGDKQGNEQKRKKRYSFIQYFVSAHHILVTVLDTDWEWRRVWNRQNPLPPGLFQLVTVLCGLEFYDRHPTHAEPSPPLQITLRLSSLQVLKRGKPICNQRYTRMSRDWIFTKPRILSPYGHLRELIAIISISPRAVQRSEESRWWASFTHTHTAEFSTRFKGELLHQTSA